ncbi:hypothetical protein FACS1894104_5230 [Actinomycetota bacterium]|nr:hypothetical protein FACS1894104_5230 [Actinomycetota bacterium]
MAVATVVIICMVGLLEASTFGIFFSSESGNGQTMAQVVSEINTEYTEKIGKIKSDNPHDNVMLTGKRALWKEVLAVYAVKTTTAETGAMEVVTVDDERKELIRTIFWDMNSITSRVEDREIAELVMVDDGNGGYTEEYQSTTIRTLYIEQHAKTVDEMATQSGLMQNRSHYCMSCWLPNTTACGPRYSTVSTTAAATSLRSQSPRLAM